MANSNHKNILHDPWLSRFFGGEVFRIVVDDELIEATRNPASSEHQLLQELQSRRVFMYAKVPSTRLASSQFLETRGFHLIDTNVTFERSCHSTPIDLNDQEFRFATLEDKAAVEKLAREGYTYSRFHLDPAIPNDLANTIKAEWAGNYFAGNRGVEMVIAQINEDVVGFLLLLDGEEETLIIDLIVVDSQHRRKGLARRMIAYAESQLSGYDRLRVGTQVANTISIRFYEENGFRMCASQYVFHYHNTERPR